jgi:hypothetical protein
MYEVGKKYGCKYFTEIYQCVYHDKDVGAVMRTDKDVINFWPAPLRYNLVEVKQKVNVDFWVNVYRNRVSRPYSTKEEADEGADKSRLACTHIVQEVDGGTGVVVCGLVGVFGDNFTRNKTIFEELLHIDQLRGQHSTGVAFLNEKYTQVIKDIVTPEELSYYKKYQKAMNKEHLALMGHNRQATRGEIIQSNAHPFSHGSITLTHNGTCSNVNTLPKQVSY